MKRDYVVETTDGSAATMTLAVREMTKAGFATTWLAAEERYTDRQKKTRTLKVSVFPGYLFVEFDAADDRWKNIHELRGVKRVLGGEKPTALPVGAVDGLKAQFRAGEFKLKSSLSPLVKDDRVVFEAGAYAGESAVVSRTKGERIEVLMKLFGATREVWVRSDMVRRAMA